MCDGVGAFWHSHGRRLEIVGWPSLVADAVRQNQILESPFVVGCFTEQEDGPWTFLTQAD